MTTQTHDDTYAFQNADVEAADRHNHLSGMLDDYTFARISSVGDLEGRRCLELGAGGGSVAKWLSEQVGSEGHVLVTDIDTRHIPANPGYTVVRHDLNSEPVPAGEWDLIHARLVLGHLKARRDILHGLVAALAPGGALVLHEAEGTIRNFVLSCPDEELAELFEAFHMEVSRVLTARGADQSWARHAHAAMLDAGLVDVNTEVHARSWAGGSPGALLFTATIAQLRAHLLENGWSAAQLDRLHQMLWDPRVIIRGLMIFSIIGRKALR